MDEVTATHIALNCQNTSPAGCRYKNNISIDK